MRFPVTVPVLCALLVLGACKTSVVRDDVPARIVDPTPASRAELRRVVSEALNGRSVRIADDALTADSLLIIEPAQLMGRDLRKPERFRLFLSGSRCVLIHEGADAQYELSTASCIAEGS